MKINIYYSVTGYQPQNSFLHIFSGLYEKLVKTNPDIEFNLIDSFLLLDKKYHCGGCKYGHSFMIIENDETKKYFVVSFWDKVKELFLPYEVTHWNIKECVEIFTSCGVHNSDVYYQPCPGLIYTPISFYTTYIENEEIIDKLYYEKKEKSYPEILSFRGYVYAFREFLSRDKRFNISNEKYPNIIDYFNELNKEYLNFAINGAAEFSPRDIEILGLGNALFRTKLVAKLHNELVPNYHYIAVDVDDVPLNQQPDPYQKQVADRIIERFEEIKNDYEFIRFVGENGRKWYEENGTIKCNIDIIHNLINFKKLL